MTTNKLTNKQLRRVLLFMEFDYTDTIIDGEIIDNKIIRVYYKDENNLNGNIANYYNEHSNDDCRQLEFILTGNLPRLKERRILWQTNK